MTRFRLSRAWLLLALVACGDFAPEPTAETNEAYTTVCPAMTVEGVDVYDGQGNITWTQVAGAGRDFAFIKATQGDYNTQTRFAASWAASKAAGVIRSPYHFFDPTIDGVVQANHFLAVVNAAGGLQPGDLPPMLDIECPTSSVQSSASANCEHTGDSGWVPTATLVTRVFDWLATVEQATGRKALIYSYPAWFADVGLTDARLAQYPLYIATLASCASVPAPWTTTVFWQYSFTGTVAGIPGQVDLDRFNGTKAQLIAFADGPVTDGGSDAATGGDAAGSDSGASGDGGGGATDSGVQPDSGVGINVAGSGGSGGGGCGCRVGAPAPLAPASFVGAFALALLFRARTRRG